MNSDIKSRDKKISAAVNVHIKSLKLILVHLDILFDYFMSNVDVVAATFAYLDQISRAQFFNPTELYLTKLSKLLSS